MRALVVGGGIIGCSIAWRLAQAFVKVTLQEAGTLGCEASSAGAGMLAPGAEFEQGSVWAELGSESLAHYLAFIWGLLGESGPPIDFRMCGAVADGVFYPDQGYVDPTDVMRALRVILKRRVELLEHHPASTISAENFDVVVIAAGAWSSSLAIHWRGRRLELPEVHPVKGHLLGYRMPPGSLGPIRRQGHTYVLQRASGFTIAGSTEEDVGFNRNIDDSICREIHERAGALWPALKGVDPVERWIGFRPATLSGEPHVGRIADTNVWLAYGHYRNGILLAPITAERIANDIISNWERD
jgi:glycine oxidase